MMQVTQKQWFGTASNGRLAKMSTIRSWSFKKVTNFTLKKVTPKLKK